MTTKPTRFKKGDRVTDFSIENNNPQFFNEESYVFTVLSTLTHNNIDYIVVAFDDAGNSIDTLPSANVCAYDDDFCTKVRLSLGALDTQLREKEENKLGITAQMNKIEQLFDELRGMVIELQTELMVANGTEGCGGNCQCSKD